jgi:uncharacterized HAD superfamily protein
MFCDIDSTVNNHQERILKWRVGNSIPYRIHANAFSEAEISKDIVMFNSSFWLNEFKSSGWQVNWISARPFFLYEVTYKWLLNNNFPVDSLTLVKRADKKLKYLFSNKVDLFVDDLSYGQENEEIILYDNIISNLKSKNVKFEIFNDNWEKIYSKYN